MLVVDAIRDSRDNKELRTAIFDIEHKFAPNLMSKEMGTLDTRSILSVDHSYGILEAKHPTADTALRVGWGQIGAHIQKASDDSHPTSVFDVYKYFDRDAKFSEDTVYALRLNLDLRPEYDLHDWLLLYSTNFGPSLIREYAVMAPPLDSVFESGQLVLEILGGTSPEGRLMFNLMLHDYIQQSKARFPCKWTATMTRERVLRGLQGHDTEEFDKCLNFIRSQAI